MIDVQMIPILEDNYAYLLRSPCGVTAIVDPGEADPIIKILEEQNLKLDYILNTHHHWDHVNGNPKLKKTYDCKIVGPAKEAERIRDVDIKLDDGDVFELGSEQAQIIETPGHTLGAICYYFAQSNLVFTGDTVFSAGCGRLFEGTAEQMFNSFQKIKSLPDETLIYCGHEYAKGDTGFGLLMDRKNEDIKKRIEEIKILRAENKPTVPTTLALEKKINVFMKAKSVDEFATLRTKKDNFTY